MGNLVVTDNGSGLITIARNDSLKTIELQFKGFSRSVVDIVVSTMEKIGNDPKMSPWDPVETLLRRSRPYAG